jgi:hypothetical protein
MKERFDWFDLGAAVLAAFIVGFIFALSVAP